MAHSTEDNEIPQGRVLIIAGSDSGGGAGIQGDIKTVTALQGYAATAVTALTAQNTQGVFGILDVPEDFIRRQMTLVLDDIGADAVKTGMLHKTGVIDTVAAILATYPSIPLVLDPVMFAKGGAALLEPDALDTLKKKLIPLAHVVTPNIPEAEYLADMRIATPDDMQQAARRILRLGCKAVLLKGGHGEGDTVYDLLATDNERFDTHVGRAAPSPYPSPASGRGKLRTECATGEGVKPFANGLIHLFEQPRLHSKHTHGTGCALASAIATGLAQGMVLTQAVQRARAYVRKAMEAAPGLGHGHGPLGHGHTVQKFID